MNLRKASFDDWKLLLEWRNDEETRRYSHTVDVIEEEQHKNWLKSVLSDDNRQLYIAVENGISAGTVKADFNAETKVYEISWTTSPDFRGKRVGKRMVKLLVDKLSGKVRAEIKKGNIASVKIAEYSGMRFMKAENDVLHYSNF